MKAHVSRLPPSLRHPLALSLIAAVAFALRAYRPSATIRTGDMVNFRGVDSWIHIRLTRSLLEHFPHAIDFDPFGRFPGGQTVDVAPLLDLVTAILALVIGAGAPSPQLVESIAAWLPPAAGTLVVVAVYLLGRATLDPLAGLVAACFVAVMPSELFVRSLLGSYDHHVLEALFCTLALAGTAMAVRTAREASEPRPGAPIGRRAALQAALAGVALGLYALSWTKAGALSGLLVVWAAIQFHLDRRAGRSSDDIAAIGAIVYAVALVMALPFAGLAPMLLNLQTLTACILAFGALAVVPRLGTRFGVRDALQPALLGLSGVLAFGAVSFLVPSLSRSVLGLAQRMSLTAGAMTVEEARPLLVEAGAFSFNPAWNEYGLLILLAPVGLVLLARELRRDPRPERLLLLVTSAALLVATFIQLRFSYYASVPVALLSALACLATPTARLPRGPVVAAVVLIALAPGASLAWQKSAKFSGVPADWLEAAIWMRENTPEPYADPRAFDALYRRRSGLPPVPDSAYGVMNWWDSGYWITALAQRIPVANPTQNGANAAAEFYVSGTEARAREILDKLESRYVVADRSDMMLPGPTGGYEGHFRSLALWASRNPTEFFEIAYVRTGGRLTPVSIFRPAYYESTVARLYLFGGSGAVPNDSSWVITWTETNDPLLGTYKLVHSVNRFKTYQEATAYRDANRAANAEIVGLNPELPCVPVAPLASLRLVHDAPPRPGYPGSRPGVRIFEYVDAAGPSR